MTAPGTPASAAPHTPAHAARTPSPAAPVTITETADRLILSTDGLPLADYVFRPADVTLESPRPYFSPVRTLGGRVVTDFRPADHVWHKGISWSLPVVGAENFWGGPSYRRGEGYVQLPNNGTQQHLGFDRIDEGPCATVVERLSWIAENGRPLFDEVRRLEAERLDDSAWLLGFETAMTNVTAQPIALGSPTTEGRPNAGYGGLFWRGPASFTGGRILAPGDGDGDGDGSGGGDELRGTRAPWMGFSGEHPDARSSTIVMVDLAGNPRHPTPWFARSAEYAGLCPAPFFDEEWIVAPGGDFRARYAVVIADGALDATSAARYAGLAQAGAMRGKTAPPAATTVSTAVPTPVPTSTSTKETR